MNDCDSHLEMEYEDRFYVPDECDGTECMASPWDDDDEDDYV